MEVAVVAVAAAAAAVVVGDSIAGGLGVTVVDSNLGVLEELWDVDDYSPP